MQQSDWKLRRDSSLPYQTWNAFKPDEVVEVCNGYGDIRVSLASELWWGYEEDLGDVGEGVILKARLATEEQKQTYLQALAAKRAAEQEASDQAFPPLRNGDYINGERVSNPTVASNIMSFLNGYASRHEVSLDDVSVEAHGLELIVHCGRRKPS